MSDAKEQIALETAKNILQEIWTREVVDLYAPILAALTRVEQARDSEWWDAVGGVPGVDATPEACRAWQITLREQAEQAAEQRERDKWQALLCDCHCHAWVTGTKPLDCDCCAKARARTGKK